MGWLSPQTKVWWISLRKRYNRTRSPLHDSLWKGPYIIQAFRGNTTFFSSVFLWSAQSKQSSASPWDLLSAHSLELFHSLQPILDQAYLHDISHLWSLYWPAWAQILTLLCCPSSVAVLLRLCVRMTIPPAQNWLVVYIMPWLVSVSLPTLFGPNISRVSDPQFHP